MVDEAQPKGWQTVCIAHPSIIDKFRAAHIEQRGSFLDVQQRFVDFAGLFVIPDA